MTRYGNWAAKVRKSERDQLIEHERCVMEYACWIMKPEQARLRSAVRRRLAGKLLKCHCQGRPCHAEVLAALANQPRETACAIRKMCVSCDI
jgi:hypothetical protein